MSYYDDGPGPFAVILATTVLVFSACGGTERVYQVKGH
jgi:hypothetical protein